MPFRAETKVTRWEPQDERSVFASISFAINQIGGSWPLDIKRGFLWCWGDFELLFWGRVTEEIQQGIQCHSENREKSSRT